MKGAKPKLNDLKVKMLIISGSMGAGKTAVLAEASDILAAKAQPHAAIDLDTLGVAHLPAGTGDDDLMYRNLACVWSNYAAAGLRALLLAGAIEDRRELQRCLEAIPGAEIVVCRLTAAIDTMQQRVRMRETGMLGDQFVKRVAELEVTLDHARLESFSVRNDERGVTEVAHEVLARAGWL